MSTTEWDERLSRTLMAFLRQEVQAPAGAITEFLDIIIEDTRRLQLNQLLPDLDRIRSASVQLNGFVTSIIQDSSDRREDETLEAFHRRLRHDLRTPLNAIKGYSELLIEDIGANGDQLRADLVKLKDSADQLLSQIDSMAALARHKDVGRDEGGRHAAQFEVVADVLRTIKPLPESGALQDAVRSCSILVVDDNTPNRDVLARRLTREGHNVVTVANGTSALDLVARRDFDIILLDLMMPGMSGFEVLRRLKAAEQTNHIPVIMISAIDELDSVVRCIEAGAEDYLTKPFNPILLRARVGASLEKNGCATGRRNSSQI